MKVKFKQSLAGADFSYGFGQIADIDTDWAEKLLESGLVERAEEGAPDGADTGRTTGHGAGESAGNQRVSKARRK